MIDYKFPYWGPFVVESTLENEFVKLLLDEGRKTTIDAHKDLAGDINKAFYYDNYDEWFIPKFKPYIDLYLEKIQEYRQNPFQYIIERNTEYVIETSKNINDYNLTWSLLSLWINIQEQKEYTPPHHHVGDLSFIIYLEVPDEIREEKSKLNPTFSYSRPGAICFDYGLEVLPFTIEHLSRVPKRGDIIIFPSWLPHHVIAFKSDVERISVSGNITLKAERK